jgi:hypothetical protein
MPICGKVLQFGECNSYWRCKKRHVLIEGDKPVNIPSDGLVKFVITGIWNPSHFSIRIKEFLPNSETKWISYKEKAKYIEGQLKSLQEKMKISKIIQTPVLPNDLCAVFLPKEVKWCRCKVIQKL